MSNEALRTGVPDRPLLTRNEAIDLIAFRDTAAPDPAESWDEAPEWWDDYSGAPSMAAALRTIARGEHVRPPLSLASLQLKYKASTGSCNKAREAAIAAFRVSEFKL
ncbi:MAG: hypothetical protein ABSA58_13485 [Acetobacteraceae bacterium]